jgi:hypothetical protein
MEFNRIKSFITLGTTFFLIVSCGPVVVRGESPLVSISSLSAIDQDLTADFDIRNINDVEMNITAIEIFIRIKDAGSTEYNSEFNLNIGANGTEEIHVDQLPERLASELLDSLESGEVLSLPFKLEGRVRTIEDGYLVFSHDGHLYPIPGKPGQFRAASTRSPEDERH